MTSTPVIPGTALQYTQPPLTIDADGLSTLLGRRAATIRADLSRRPWTLPPAIKVGRRTLWLTETVLAWLKSHERAATPPQKTAPREMPAALPPRRRGRPTKADQLARAGYQK
jgi:predicted DNA-binding transcriptional regulator AlpA